MFGARVGVVAAALVLSGASGRSASAEAPEVALPPLQYNGAFVGAGLLGGVSILQDRRWDEPVGWTVGAYGRIASVLSLVDVQLEYHAAGHDIVSGPGAPADLTLERHTVVTSFNLHPLFLSVLGNNWWSFALSGIYAQAGLSVEFSKYRTDAVDWRRSDTAFSLHIGAGVDVPLGDANGQGAFWMGAMWRWKFVYMDPKLELAGESPDELNTHALMVTVSYRYNDLSFGREESARD